MHKLALIIKKSRQKAKLTLKGAADKLYINERTVSRYEAGEALPGPPTIMNMSDKYNDSFLPKQYCREGCSIGNAFSFVPLEDQSLELVLVQLLNYMDEAQIKLKPLRKLVGKEDFTHDSYELEQIIKIFLKTQHYMETLVILSGQHIDLRKLIKDHNKEVKAAILRKKELK